MDYVLKNEKYVLKRGHIPNFSMYILYQSQRKGQLISLLNVYFFFFKYADDKACNNTFHCYIGNPLLEKAIQVINQKQSQLVPYTV